MRARAWFALACAWAAAATSGCGSAGLSGVATGVVALFDPKPSPTPVAQTTGTIAPGSAAVALAPSNGYVGAVVFAPSVVPPGTTLAIAATAKGAPAPVGGTALATWELTFGGPNGTAAFDGFPTVTLAVLTAANLSVALFDGSEPGAPPVVLAAQAQVNGFVTFVAQAPAAPTYFLLTHAYWLELVAGSASPRPSPAPAPAPSATLQESP